MRTPFIRLCGVLIFISLAMPLRGWASQASLDLLKELVEINSGSANIEGVNRIQEIVAKRLKTLGFTVQLIENPQGPKVSGKLLVGTFEGISKKIVTILTHSDTVFDLSSPFQKFTLSEDGKKASGPGVIDDKGGIVVALEGLEKFLKAQPKPGFTIRFVSSPNEEVASVGFVKLFTEFGLDSAMVLGLEPARKSGAIVKGRKGNRWYHIQVTGKEAHSGVDHQDGVNACLELSMKLAQLSRLTDYKRGMTVSIGRMEGGKDKFNIVCGHAQAKVDARFSDFKTSAELHGKIVAILGQTQIHSAKGKVPTKTEWTIEDESPPLESNSESRVHLSNYLKTIDEVEGKHVEAEATGGTGDTNTFSRVGSIILDGLGPIGDGVHTPEEFIQLDSIESRAEVLKKFLITLKL